MWKFLLIQLLIAANVAAGGSEVSLDNIKSYADYWRCQGSPAKIKEQIVNLIVADLSRVDTTQPVCWTPAELEGALAYIICKLLTTISGGGPT